MKNLTITSELKNKINDYKLYLENFDKLSGLCNPFNREARANNNRTRLAIKFKNELQHELGSIKNIVEYLKENF